MSEEKSSILMSPETPTQGWLARQITEAFPWDTAPRFLLRDRDASYGQTFRDRVQAMAIEEVVTAPRSPWQNAYVERIIGSIRRECLDHVIVFDERHLRRVLSAYFEYHHRSRTHLSLGKDCPEPRPYSHRLQVPLLPSHRPAACTIATSVVQPEPAPVSRCQGGVGCPPSHRSEPGALRAPSRKLAPQRAALCSMPNFVGRGPQRQSDSMDRWLFEQGQAST